jgi:FdhD protein
MGVTTGRRAIVRVVDGHHTRVTDAVAVESPLTVVLDGEPIMTTMRTPGHDLELVAGWLVNESGVRAAADIASMGAFATHADADGRADTESVDTVRVALAAGVRAPRPRAFVTSSACGVCSADVLAAFAGPDAPLHREDWRLPAARVPGLIDAMRAGQRMFDTTGALHAAALVDPGLGLLWVREDVGRHNAVDKVVGKALLDRGIPLTDHVLVVSGRISYEIVHKALTAGVAAVVAVSGPTTLAVDLAREHGLLLAGFVRGDRVNVYAGEHLLELADVNAEDGGS